MKDEIKEILDYLAFLEDIDTQKKVKQVADYITTLQQENERLNNIINELEKDLEDIFYGRGQHFMDSSVVPIKYVLDKLQELKEKYR